MRWLQIFEQHAVRLEPTWRGVLAGHVRGVFMVRFHVLLLLSTELLSVFFVDDFCNCLIMTWRLAVVKGGSSIGAFGQSSMTANLIIIACQLRLIEIGI